ncbi:hypothetical protein L228DRAFT_10249 [Xylona heveae TC161]|uniref:Protein kinase domain-containing protein n=1 Tax=Xylona heveae (strain CBS 132557 / TC161) TaxID=1328760 RepID=A0A165JJX3_XYLHT|nr:hypothetical protein L228DRAFT_10249 [Xylona heveae TC161]KZF26331.1 hypothetical protein L228DRAFT_10249 [Xylona heveae TC161]
MFSSALKSFTSNISANYSIASNPISVSGPWKIYDAKRKSTGQAVSVFVFDKKLLDPRSGGLAGGRANTAALKKLHEEIIERLKKEVGSLAKLRHPSILELAEPVEETRNGGLMFATEPVTASLAGLLKEQDEQERLGGLAGRTSRYVVEDADGGRRRREVEIDELEIQKGLLQVAKGLEFLHESAGLVHGNLTPDAIYLNSKSDWKISGLGFSGPATDAESSVPIFPISLSEVLHHDPRLPRSVQLDLDYTSPDFVLDGNITSSADMFSMGLLIVALYNTPHISPIQTNSSVSAYKKIFASHSSLPSQTNNYLSAKPLPKELATSVLPRLICRRPAQRLNALEFQQSTFFDNILVSTIRFLETLPAKSATEKTQFMRGLQRILPQFPKSVLEKKVLPALLEEVKDRSLLALTLRSVFKIISTLPSERRVLKEKVNPKLREIFLSSGSTQKASGLERDTGKEAGLMVVLENMNVFAEFSSTVEFKSDIWPIMQLALGSSTHGLIDAALQTLPVILPVLDVSTTRDELFPTIATIFTKTSSLAIKIQGLNSLYVLCGGSFEDQEEALGDDLNGVAKKPETNFKKQRLDKFTVQEKVVPLLKGIKTREPAVMMAALGVFRQVGDIGDSDFVALEVLPILWSFALGPLLNLEQFQKYMSLIKGLSNRIESEQLKKLRELSSSTPAPGTASLSRVSPFGAPGRTASRNGTPTTDEATAGTTADFEQLVLGKKSDAASNEAILDGGWASSPASAHPPKPQQPSAPVFSWSTVNPSAAAKQPTGVPRAITPDMALNNFAPLNPMNPSRPGPSTTNGSQPSFSTSVASLQPQNYATSNAPNNAWTGLSPQRTSSGPSLATLSSMQSTATNTATSPWASNASANPAGSASAFPSSFVPPSSSLMSPPPLAPPPAPSLSSSSPLSAFSIPPPRSSKPGTPVGAQYAQTMQPRYGAGLAGGMGGTTSGGFNTLPQAQPMNSSSFSTLASSTEATVPMQPANPQKQGLDAYESLL